MKTIHTIYNNFAKRMFTTLMVLMTAGITSAWAATTVTLSNFTINGTVTDSQGNTWTITTVGTTSSTNHDGCLQIGTELSPATSITLTTTLPSPQKINSFSATLSGYNSEAVVALKVGNTSVGTGVINTSHSTSAPITITNTSASAGTVLTISITNIQNGINLHNVSYTYESTTTQEVQWIVDGDVWKAETLSEGSLDVSQLPENPDNCSNDIVFVGWTKQTNVDGNKPADLFNSTTLNNLPNIVGTTTFYAVYATPDANSVVGEITDVLNKAKTGNPSSYTIWQDVKDQSNAVYAGQSAGGNESIQLRDESPSGIISTASGGKARKVVVTWHSNTKNGRTLDIYGKNTAYESSADLYDLNKVGTKLGSIVYGTSTELTIDGDYEYIGLRSNDGAMYLTSISIEWYSEGSYTEYTTNCSPNYTITLNPNGGDGGDYTGWTEDNGNYTLRTKENTSVELPTPTRKGYYFNGWYHDGTPVSSPYTVTTDVTLIANWSQLNQFRTSCSYTLTWDLNGGIVTEAGTHAEVDATGICFGDVEFGAPITAPIVEQYAYKFLGWSEDGTNIVEPESTMPAEDLTYIAVWAEEYTVTYDANGGTTTCEDNKYIEGDIVIVCATEPTKIGYTFAGWNDGTNTYQADGQFTMPANNVTLTAQWTANTNTPYKVEHYQEALDGSYTLVETEDLFGTTDAEVTPATKTYEGFTAPTTKTVPILADGSLVVEYQYTRNSYQLTWDLNGGTEIAAGTPEGDVKYEAPLTAPQVERNGYTFAGWEPVVPATMPAEDQTFKAIWENCRWVETTTIEDGDEIVFIMVDNPTSTSYAMNNEVTSTDPLAVVINTDIFSSGSVPNNIIWDIQKDADGIVFYSKTAANNSIYCTKSYTRVGVNTANTFALYKGYIQNLTYEDSYLAVATGAATTKYWRQYAYSSNNITNQTLKLYKRICLDDTKHWVTWDANGGLFADGSTTQTTSLAVGATITHPANPTREGHTFTGWSPTTSTVEEEDITFVAQWQVNTYTVTWNANGGKFGNETSVEQSYLYGATITAPTPTRTGYTFAGWDSEVPETMPASNLTYNAQWNCTSPTDIKINGAYIVFPGETIELTVTGSNIADDATYQWYKKNGDSYDELEEQTTNTLRIDNCVVGDAANYKCVVTNGTCSAENNFTVKMYRLRGLTDPENTWTTDFVFSKAEGKTATYEITLNGASNYKFKVHDGSAYYGNNEDGDNPNPTMTHVNCTNWTMQENKGYNVILQTTITGVYTFVLDYTDESNPKISVIYPSKKMVYLNPGDWTSSKYAVYAWNGNTNNTYLMTKVDDCTDRNIYQAEIDATYNNVIFIGGNASYNVSNPWTNVERQTIDLTYPSDDKLLYELNTTHLFLKPNTNWKKDGARFAAYFFDNGEAWVSMTKVNDDLYKVQIPTNKTYPSVIFCRMNGGTTANNWDNRWNQSSNLTITKGNNHYTIEERDDNWSDGTWKTAGSWTDFIPFYTISYNMNGHGTQISDDCIEDGHAWDAPTDPTAVGYTFLGWRRPATTNDNTLYKYGQTGFTPTANEELTAQWSFSMEYAITGTANVTSAVEQTIKATTPLQLAVSNMPVGTKVAISAPNITFYDEAGNAITEVTTKNNPEQFNLTIAYTPTVEKTTEQPTITLSVLGNEKTFDGHISARSLPNTFAIVAKVGNLWYALPSQGLNSTDDLMGYAIEVDNQNDPTLVTSVPANADWSLRQVYAGQNANATKDRFKQYGNNLVFVNSDVKALNASSSGSHVLTDAKYTNYYDQYPGRYEWTPITTDLETYQLTNAQRTDRELSIDILTRFGVYAGEITDIRFLPIQEPRYTQAALQVVEWKENSVVIMYNGDPAQKATLAIDGTTQIGAANLNDVKKDVAIYELPASGLMNYATKPLLITIGSSKKWLTIPYIINNSTTDADVLNSTNTTKEVAAVTDVVVLNDATFTAAGTKNDKYTFRTIHVYGGGKLVVPAEATEGLGIYSLVMRSGTIENGTYTNSYPQLVMNGKYSNTSGIYLDYITTYERYYALSVPYSVKTKNIKYPADIYGDNLKDGGNKASFALQYYDGNARATGATGWKDFDESGAEPTLTPYQGYTFWGAPRKVSVNGGAMERQKYGIHRIQLTGVGAEDLLKAETSDKTIDIIAYPAERPNDMGWNFLGNPYLAQYGGLSADNELVQVGLLEQEMIDGKWTGGWKHTGNLRYITTTSDGQNYTAVEVDKATFSPFNTFFIQAATNGQLQFAWTSRAQSLPARQYAAQQEAAKEITTGIILTGNDQTDRTGLLIADNFTEEYDFNADLSKFENSGINLYTIGKDGKLAFMAINQALAEQPIPLGYSAPADGEYTIAFDEDRYNATDISALYLIDYDRNETTNLLHTDYSFVTTAGTNNERFALQVAFIPQNATNIEWVEDATIQVAVDGNNLLLNNLPTDAGVQVFDALGRVIYATPNAPREMQITLPTGYYLVRIADKQHAVVINTVIP